MAHFPKPWFRASRGLWFVQLHGKQHPLGPDKEAAFRRYHELMAAPPSECPKTPPTSDKVACLFDRFLEWVQKNQAPDQSAGTVAALVTLHTEGVADRVADRAGYWPATPLRRVETFLLLLGFPKNLGRENRKLVDTDQALPAAELVGFLHDRRREDAVPITHEEIHGHPEEPDAGADIGHSLRQSHVDVPVARTRLDFHRRPETVLPEPAPRRLVSRIPVHHAERRTPSPNA